jgi:hypothetical protein
MNTSRHLIGIHYVAPRVEADATGEGHLHGLSVSTRFQFAVSVFEPSSTLHMLYLAVAKCSFDETDNWVLSRSLQSILTG